MRFSFSHPKQGPHIVREFRWESSSACMESGTDLGNILEYRDTEPGQAGVVGAMVVVITRSVDELVPQVAHVMLELW
jgi:hypothetical protein